MENRTKLKEVLHFYLGQPVRVWFEDENGKFTVERKGTLSWNHEEDSEWIKYQLEISDEYDAFESTDFIFKLCLRRLSSMTDDELKEFVNQPSFTEHYCKKKLREIGSSIYGLYNFLGFYGSQNSMPWLFSKGFDLFNLIDSGQAIEQTEYNSQKV